MTGWNRIILCASAIPFLGGCGTLWGLGTEEVPVYAGVQTDTRLIGTGKVLYKGPTEVGPVLRILAVLDLPLSFALDTGLLPIMALFWIFDGKPEPAASELPPPKE
jgi:uncharacterized protein YceK